MHRLPAYAPTFSEPSVIFLRRLEHIESRATIGDRAATDRLSDPGNAAGIGDNSAEIGDDAAGIVDIAANVIGDPMLNSVLNGDWSNSVAGRQIPDGEFVHLRRCHL